MDYRDVDDTLDTLTVRFLNEYAEGLPSALASTSTDKRKMVKHMSDLYRAKGTENSYKTFFRLLYNEDIDLYYPSNNILTLSSGKWVEPTFIYTTVNMDAASVQDLPGRRVHQVGLTHGIISAYGYVEKAEQKLKNGYSYLESEISGVYGTFEPLREVFYAITGGAVVNEYLFPVLKSVGISAGGIGYKVGDEVVVSGGTFGVGARVYVSSASEKGSIRGTDILDHGIYYAKEDVLSATVTTSGNGSGAEIIVAGGAGSQNRQGFWDGEDGILSGSSKMQDNNYYQSFSYVIRSTRNISEYKKIFKKMIHPAGFRMFGNFLLSDNIVITGVLDRETKVLESPVIGHYTPYTFSLGKNLRANGLGGSGGLDLYPDGYNWGLAAGNTYYDPNDFESPASPILVGSSGPLGGITHVIESIGTTASFGPGGALNAVQGAQFAVEGAADAFDGVSTGTTGGAYWEIYPHFNARGFKDLPNVNTYNVSRVQIDRAPTFNLHQIVRQKTPNRQEATGIISALIGPGPTGSHFVYIKSLSGQFTNSGESSGSPLGGTSGLLEGPIGGQTASINNVQYGYSTISDVGASGAVMGSLSIKSVLSGMDKYTTIFGSG